MLTFLALLVYWGGLVGAENAGWRWASLVWPYGVAKILVERIAREASD